MWLSLWTSRWVGWRASASLVLMDVSTGRLGSMGGLRGARGRLRARQVEMGRAEWRTLDSIRTSRRTTGL